MNCPVPVTPFRLMYTNESDANAADRRCTAGTSIPGPYNNDSDAATAGVAVGAIYKNSNGTIHWRVS